MLKVFIAEDESVVREGLRDSIPWGSYGYEFVGDAMDGETALPMILDVCPDLLITDIRMPFMDGLELIRRVREVLPNIHIIILSGYDDFDYARQAIELRVTRYLLKPILKADMVRALMEVREQIEEEHEKQNYLTRFKEDRQEYENYSRIRLFEDLIGGKLSETEANSRAEELSISLSAECYQTVLFMLQPGTTYSETATLVQEKVIQRILEHEDMVLFRAGILSYCVLLERTQFGIHTKEAECLSILKDCCGQAEDGLEWFASSGLVVQNLCELHASYAKAGKLIAFRHFLSQQHIISQKDVDGIMQETGSIDYMNIDPMVIRSFIKSGLASEISSFVADFLASTGDSCQSVLFRNYIVVSVRLNAAMVIQDLGLSREEYISQLPPATINIEENEIPQYICSLLKIAIEMRDAAAQNRNGDIVNLSLEYIQKHYSDENISLNTVAKAINISANYLSAAFSQKIGIPFVEYITEKRMERAKELLRQTPLRSGEIGALVGYHDPRYFSFVFRKTQGCSPKEYRAGVSGR